VYSNYSMEYVLYMSVGLYTRTLYKLLLRCSADVSVSVCIGLRKHIYFYKANYQYIQNHHGASVPLFNPLKPELNPICYLLELLGAQHFLHVNRIRVKLLTFRLLMSYIYIWSTHS